MFVFMKLNISRKIKFDSYYTFCNSPVFRISLSRFLPFYFLALPFLFLPGIDAGCLVPLQSSRRRRTKGNVVGVSSCENSSIMGYYGAVKRLLGIFIMWYSSTGYCCLLQSQRLSRNEEFIKAVGKSQLFAWNRLACSHLFTRKHTQQTRMHIEWVSEGLVGWFICFSFRSLFGGC